MIEAAEPQLPRVFRGGQRYGAIATLVAMMALLFSSFSIGSTWQWGNLAFLGLLFGIPTLLGAMSLFLSAYNTFAKKLVVDGEGLSLQHHSTVLLHLPWSDVRGLFYDGEQGSPRARYLIRTEDDTLTLSNLERQDELVALLSRLTGQAWRPLAEEGAAP